MIKNLNGGFLVQRCITEDAELKMFYNVNLAVGL